MSDQLNNAFVNVPTGTSAGLKVKNATYAQAIANDASLATGVVILTYTPTTGVTAIVTGVSVYLTSGAADTAVVSFILNSQGSVDITVASIAFGAMTGASAWVPLGITLLDGDVFELLVTTTDASETADVAIYASEIN